MKATTYHLDSFIRLEYGSAIHIQLVVLWLNHGYLPTDGTFRHSYDNSCDIVVIASVALLGTPHRSTPQP